MTALQIPPVPLKVSASIYRQQGSPAFVFLLPPFNIPPVYGAAFSNRSSYLFPFKYSSLPSWSQWIVTCVQATRWMSLIQFSSLTYHLLPHLSFVLRIRIKAQFYLATRTLFNLEFIQYFTHLSILTTNRNIVLLSKKPRKLHYLLV